jgi:hypothetical protein
MISQNLFFTVAFGNKRYKNMALALKKSFLQHNPKSKFKIFDENDFTPSKKFLKEKKKIYPKDYKYAKFEIMSNLTEQNTNYIFIDADSFVMSDISYYLNFIKDNHLTIEYKYDGSLGWNKISKYNFLKSCDEAGLKNIEPYSLNGGFMMWRGKIKCFHETVRTIRNYDILDGKGTTGEEYYLSVAIQKSKTNINPIDYNKNNFIKLWNYKFYVKNFKLFINGSNDKQDIVHYGNFNYYNSDIQKLLKRFNPDIKFDLKDKVYTTLQMLKNMLRNFNFNG